MRGSIVFLLVGITLAAPISSLSQTQYEFQFVVTNGGTVSEDISWHGVPAMLFGDFHAGSNINMSIGPGGPVLYGGAPVLTFHGTNVEKIRIPSIAPGQTDAFFQFEHAALAYDPHSGSITGGTVKVDIAGQSDKLNGDGLVTDFRTSRLMDGNSPSFNLDNGLGVGSGGIVLDAVMYLPGFTNVHVTFTGVLGGESMKSGFFREPDTRTDPPKVKLPQVRPEKETIAKPGAWGHPRREMEDALDEAKREIDDLRRSGRIRTFGTACAALVVGLLLGRRMTRREEK